MGAVGCLARVPLPHQAFHLKYPAASATGAEPTADERLLPRFSQELWTPYLRDTALRSAHQPVQAVATQLCRSHLIALHSTTPKRPWQIDQDRCLFCDLIVSQGVCILWALSSVRQIHAACGGFHRSHFAAGPRPHIARQPW